MSRDSHTRPRVVPWHGQVTLTAEFLRTYGLLKALAFALNSSHQRSWERKTKEVLRRLLYAALTSLINIYIFSPTTGA